MTKFAISLVLAFCALLLAATPASNVTLCASTLPLPACAGCIAGKHQDPNIGVVDGIRVHYKNATWGAASGFAATLVVENGKCEGTPCLPTGECKFIGALNVLSTVGPFRNSNGPAQCSQPMWDGSGHGLESRTPEWLGSCADGQVNVVSLLIYDGPNEETCTGGDEVLHIQFWGVCSSCGGS